MTKKDGRVYTGIRVQCPNPEHTGCVRFRSLHMWLDRFGERAAELYLGVWLSRAFDLDAATHRKYFPTAQQVRDFRDARGPE